MLVRSRARRALGVLALTLAIVASSSRPATAARACDPDGLDAIPVAEARTAVQAACDCASVQRSEDWRRCVRETLAGLPEGTVSASCARHVHRVETRSSCGRAGQIVCCRTQASSRTLASLRRPDACTAPARGSACASSSPYLGDACSQTGCAPEPECGNGVLSGDEDCDPPNGTTCSDVCTRCAREDGLTLLGCRSRVRFSHADPVVHAAATASTFLVAYTDVAPAIGERTVVKRLGNDGAVLDAAPVAVSTWLPGTMSIGGPAAGATAIGDAFHVGWTSFVSSYEYDEYVAGRGVPARGPVSSEPELYAHARATDVCGALPAGPLGLAPTLASDDVHVTFRNLHHCWGSLLYETITGVGPFFPGPVSTSPLPPNVSTSHAPLARGTGDVAAVWRNVAVTPTASGKSFEGSLSASFIEPGPAEKIVLAAGSATPPSLAALGDVFLAAFARGSEVRAMRFTRADGPLDGSDGILVAIGTARIGSVAVAADGSRFVVAWSEKDESGNGAVRATRVAADGTLPDPTPRLVTAHGSNASVSVAANATAALVAFTRDEGSTTSVRAAVLVD